MIVPLSVGNMTCGNHLANKPSRQKTEVSTLAKKNTPKREVEKITIGEEIEYVTHSVCPAISLHLLTLTASVLLPQLKKG